MMHSAPLAAALLAVFATLVVGCGPARPPTGQVTGQVSLDGRPLARGTLTFEAAGLRPATAQVEAGRILPATTFAAGDGVPIGRHAVAVFAREQPAGDAGGAADPGSASFSAASMAGRSLLPARYTDPRTSGIAVTIEPGDNVLDIRLESRPP